VVVSHLDRGHKSALTEILSRVSSMPVQEAAEGTPVGPEHVYVIPPNRDLTIREGALHLTPRAESRVPPTPVDTFLRSLAGDCGNRAVGVILSGTGTDGTVGMKQIREAGGLTFAQDDTARFTGMPHCAIAAGVVDTILPPAKIAAELLRIASQSPAALVHEAALSDEVADQDDFLDILRLLSVSSGVDFLNYKHSTLRRRIARRMVLRRVQALHDYLQSLRDDETERRSLFEEVLIPVTNFFREPGSFDALKSTVLPRLIAHRSPKTPFRVWVPGCTSGEEAYSIAICLLEYLSGTEAIPIKVFGTDVSERAIETARAGAYGEGIATEVSSERLARFFLKTDRGYEISKAIRDVCIFARHDLTRDPPFSRLDLLSCRNVLIYFGPALQDRVLPVLHYALNPGGILTLGSSETVGQHTDIFDLVDKKHRFYVRTSTPSRLSLGFKPPAAVTSQLAFEELKEPGGGFADLYREVDRLVLGRYGPSGVLVDEKYSVVQFRGDAASYLRAPPGPPTTDLLLLAREGLLGELQETLDQARRDKAPARQEGVRVKTDDHFVKVDLEVLPIRDSSTGLFYFVVLFNHPDHKRDEGMAGQAPHRHPTGQESEKDREISRLNRDLSATRAFLQSVVEEKESANEELRAANEEVLSANEELQSTNEELMAAKEELQATNEELTTVNDELDNRIQAVNLLAGDMVNLIESTQIPIVVLGSDLCILRFTPAAETVMKLRSSDVGRPFLDLKTRVNLPGLEPLVRDVFETLEIKQREVTDETGAWHKLYIRPYKTLDQKIGGVVLTLIDIDALKRREQEIKESRDYAVSIVETVREPLLVLDDGLRVRTANRSFYESFRVSPSETEGRLIYDLGDGQWNIPRLRTLLEELLPQNRHLENFEVEHVFPLIGERTMLLNAHRVIQGEDSGEQLILLAIEDVTVRKHAERLRQETEDRLSTIVDTAVDAIITIDDQGRVSSVNAATERMFGYASAELIGQNVRMLMPPPYRNEHDGYLARYRQTSLKHIIGIGREVLGRRKDGSIFPVDLAVSEFSDRGQRRFTGVLRDLSARKALEREVLEVATMEEQRIGQELHDTSAQELTALGLLAERLISASKGQPPTVSRLATKIASGLDRVLGQVRAFSRGLIRVEVDAEGLMAALGELAAQTTELHGVTCLFECEKPVPIDDNQVATQLYSIAREAVTNALRHARARNITIRLAADDRTIKLSVLDDGSGIQEPALDTRGMGLKIMRYRAGLINAHLSVRRAQPVGTCAFCSCNKGARDGQGQARTD
jgi:two-component system CheB/CheR fusion protein